MKVESKVLMIAFLAALFVSPAFGGEAGVVRSNHSYVVRSNPGTIARLQDAADKAQRDALDGNKNNLEFRRKNYEIEQVIARLEEGQPVPESEVDDALTPVHVW
jgi:hypothetical protein